MVQPIYSTPGAGSSKAAQKANTGYPFGGSPPTKLPNGLKPSVIVQDLKKALHVGEEGRRVEVTVPGEEAFVESSALFNGAVKTHAFVLIKPENALDVSTVVKYCHQHNIELSVKAGGRGVHGWSVAGHVILDLCLMINISTDLPDASAPTLQESFQRLDLHSNGVSTDDPPPKRPKRPSLSDLRQGSSDQSTSTVTKRAAHDAWDDDTDGQADGIKLQKRLDSINEDSSRSSSSSTPGSSSSGDKEPSNSSSEGHTGSGSSGDQVSTPGTSLRASEGSLNPPKFSSQNMATSPLLDASLSSDTPAYLAQPSGRTTYVNPSPTATSPFPFVNTSYGASTSQSAAYTSTVYPRSFQGQPSVQANIVSDPPEHVIVTFGAGTTSKLLDSTTARSPFGPYFVPTSAFPVGSGQFLSGGFGFVGRKHGLAMDNLIEAELVLSDGRIVWVGEDGRHGGEWKDDEHPREVWWALRGAGATLGVITRFRAKAYYIPSVYAGNFIYMFDPESTPALLRNIRDVIKGAPRTLYLNIIMTAGPPGSGAIVVVQMCFSGTRSEGEMYVQLVSSCDGGKLIFRDFAERTFERQQVAVEEVLKGGKGRKWFIKSDLLLSLTDNVIDESCQRFGDVPDGCTWLFEFTGGGHMSDVRDTCFPSSHREAAFTVAALHQWTHDEPRYLDNRCVTTAEEWINEVIHPNSPGGPLPCFLQSATEPAVRGVFGESFERLRALKEKLDPTNFFRHAMWPRPGGPDERRQLGEGDPQDMSIDALRGEPDHEGGLPGDPGCDAVTINDEGRGGWEGEVQPRLLNEIVRAGLREKQKGEGRVIDRTELSVGLPEGMEGVEGEIDGVDNGKPIDGVNPSFAHGGL